MPGPLDDLTAREHARLLHGAYCQDRELGGEGPDPITRQELAYLLGCHEAQRATAWAEWRVLLLLEQGDHFDAAYWLDVEFVGPRPAHQE